jgi:hypothetical protein
VWDAKALHAVHEEKSGREKKCIDSLHHIMTIIAAAQSFKIKKKL